MLLLLLALVAGMAAGRARGGRLRHISELRLRSPYLLVVAALAQFVVVGLAPSPRFVLLVSEVVVGAWLVLNVRTVPQRLRIGLGIAAVGWLLNALPIAANGAMPVSADALTRLGQDPVAAVADGSLEKHVLAGPDTTLAWLGTSFPSRSRTRRQVSVTSHSWPG